IKLHDLNNVAYTYTSVVSPPRIYPRKSSVPKRGYKRGRTVDPPSRDSNERPCPYNNNVNKAKFAEHAGIIRKALIPRRRTWKYVPFLRTCIKASHICLLTQHPF